MVIKKSINIGVAVAIEDGLLVPVIPDADQKDLLELSKVSKENAQAAGRGIIKTPASGTFTLSNQGMFKVNQFLPIINPPECAILGVGGIAKKVTARPGGDMGVRDIMVLTLACDHRATDGTYAAQFLNRVKENLEDGLIP
jgi:pyruvate dehydrogenase E2 component (dihydrolipoamide acetyltransferase)